MTSQLTHPPSGPLSSTPAVSDADTPGALIAAERARQRRRRLTRYLILGALPLVLFLLVAVIGPILIPYDAVTVRLSDRLKAPLTELRDGTTTLLGTDQVGRDLLPQVLQGARISLLVGLSTVLAAGAAGLLIGVLSGYYGGWFDTVAMRLADIQLAFPSILLAILIAAVLGPSVLNVILTLSLTRWVTFARVARAATLSTRELEYVHAAQALGATDARIISRHVLPSTIAPLVVVATVEVGLVIIAEASLSFLGLGTPPDQPSWGATIANGRAYLNIAWWISTMPGIALSLVVLAVGRFGDQLRDVLDPRSLSRI
ncbi:MAG: ABC transporter permease [Chloroflexi bacterium]|nr:ABC transporter permease [Chloroflexota bacterium]